MITVAVVNKNRCNFEQLEEHASCLLYTEYSNEERKSIKQKINDYLWSEIEPFITFVDVPKDDFIGCICDNLISCFPEKTVNDFFYHSEGSYSFPKKYIEFAHCQPVWKGYEQSQLENMNNIGCLFSLKHNVIENNCVIFANKYDLNVLTAPKMVQLESITKEDILKVIRRRFFFTAVLIKYNRCVKYYYQNPIYLISKIYNLQNETDLIEKLSTSIFRYNLVFYFQHDKSRYVNELATRINGSYRLHGDILVLHELEENIYSNISLNEINNLNQLSYGRLYDRQLKLEEIHTVTTIEADSEGNQTEKKVVPYWSKYLVIENRISNKKLFNKNCINCEKELNSNQCLTCQRCFRVKYCSEKCQKEFNNYHSDECINLSSL